MINDSSLVLYEEEVTTAHELPSQPRQWNDEKTMGYELTDTKCYKTLSGVQKTATIQCEHVSNMKEPVIEQVVEMDGEYDMDGVDLQSVAGTSTSSSSLPSVSTPNEPSTSTATAKSVAQLPPLRRMAIKIGERVIRFKLINASDAPEAPADSSDAWLRDPRPLIAPRSLAGLYHCANCKTYFGNKEVFKRHVLEVHGDARPFRCFNCGMRFSNKTAMTHHLKEHSLLKVMHACDYCPRIFGKAESKAKHLKLHFTGNSCPDCHKFYTTVEALRTHQATSHQEQFEEGPPPEDLLPNGKTARFNCSYCNLRFHFKKDKEIHERVHTGEKPYSCPYCNKAFAQKQACTAHIRTHTNESPYACAKCPKRFRDNSCLRKHELAVHMDTPVIRSVSLEYTQQIRKQIENQKMQRRKQEMLLGERNPSFRLS